MKNLLAGIIVFLIAILNISPTFAHVVVKPSQAGVGTFQTFTIGVPVEKDTPTTEIRLIIPEGLNHVTPNVKPGWSIQVSKIGDTKGKVLNTGEVLSDEEANRVSEIRWHGGLIPSGQRDEFLFSAQVPTSESILEWKAYQTYQDGTVVAWDQDPTKHHDDKDETSSTPSSTTKVINDLAPKNNNAESKSTDKSGTILSIIALALSGAAIAMQLRKR